jgi:hypothetical protein
LSKSSENGQIDSEVSLKTELSLNLPSEDAFERLLDYFENRFGNITFSDIKKGELRIIENYSCSFCNPEHRTDLEISLDACREPRERKYRWACVNNKSLRL